MVHMKTLLRALLASLLIAQGFATEPAAQARVSSTIMGDPLTLPSGNVLTIPSGQLVELPAAGTYDAILVYGTARGRRTVDTTLYVTHLITMPGGHFDAGTDA